MSSAPELRLSDDTRIASIDLLRGVAVCGILTMNIQSFAMPFEAYSNPAAYGSNAGFDLWIWRLQHVLADQKFMTVFSMLFGAGICLMTSRAAERGPTLGLHYRRMTALLLFGLAHGWLVWYGDILFTYALGGMAIYPCRKLRPRMLLLLGVATIAFCFAIGAVMSRLEQEFGQGERPPGLPLPADEIRGYRGGYAENLAVRLPATLLIEFVATPLWLFWRAAGNMLLGMAFYKLGLFSAAKSRRFYALLTIAGCGIGIPLAAFGVYRIEARNFDPAIVEGAGQIPNFWASEATALGIVGLVMLLSRSERFEGLKRRLGAVGRMAFTNYLTQSLIATSLFYGFGFGLFGKLDRGGLLGVVLGIWLLQLIWSPLWLARFRYGPFEWLWRAATYLRLPAMRSRAPR